MSLTERQRRLRNRKAAKLVPQLRDFLESKGNQGRWFTKADLERHFGVCAPGPDPDALDVALGRLVRAKYITTKRRGRTREVCFARFPLRQLVLGMADSELCPLRPDRVRASDIESS